MSKDKAERQEGEARIGHPHTHLYLERYILLLYMAIWGIWCQFFYTNMKGYRTHSSPDTEETESSMSTLLDHVPMMGKLSLEQYHQELTKPEEVLR